MALSQRINNTLLRNVIRLNIGTSYVSTSVISSTNDVTHTGQQWEKDDYRNIRYTNAPKTTNSKWAINLIKEVPPTPVKGRVAICEGGPSESLGHPKIFINLDEDGPQSCIYCGLRFIQDHSH